MTAVLAGANAVLLEDLTAGALYPPGNWWGVDITNAPVDPASDDMLRWIGGRQLHPDFGPPPYGIPYLTVSASTPRVPITFVDYPEESDAGAPGSSGYPVPDEAKSQPNYIEGGVPGRGSDGDPSISWYAAISPGVARARVHTRGPKKCWLWLWSFSSSARFRMSDQSRSQCFFFQE